MFRIDLRAGAVLLAACFVTQVLAADKKKKDKEEITQTLEVLPDPPAVVKAEVGRMSFHVSPLSNKGLLSQQVRDAIKAIWKQSRGDTIVRLRALVAGTGDQRRVQAIVSEMFAEKRLPLPVVSTIQVGLLPMDGAQVILEASSVSSAKKLVNPHGLAFFSGQAVSAPLDPNQTSMPVAPLAEKSLANLTRALEGARLTPADVIRTTCFTSSLDDYGAVRGMVASQFAAAVSTIAQIQRSPTNAVVECEAVARLKEAAGAPAKWMNVNGLEASPNYSHVTFVGPGPVVISGAQLGFRAQDSDVRLAFERLKASLEQGGASIRRVAMSNIYPTSRTIMDKIRAIRFEFYDKANPPASTMLPFEGLPSLDATFAVDVVAVP